MKRLILVIALLTASMAFGHESENDPKHNAIHGAYIGKINHAHSHGNADGVVRGDFHDHENSYKFSDDSHNQKLSDYYISLHDVNNRDNFNERGELFFDHGLHTPEYVVTPPVQSNGNFVSKGVESTPDAVSTPRSTRVVIAPVVLPTNVLKITYLSFAEVWGRSRIDSNMVLALQLTAYTPDTQHNLLIIVVNGHGYPTPYHFFGDTPLNANEMREVSIAARPKNSAVLSESGNAKQRALDTWRELASD